MSEKLIQFLKSTYRFKNTADVVALYRQVGDEEIERIIAGAKGRMIIVKEEDPKIDDSPLIWRYSK